MNAQTFSLHPFDSDSESLKLSGEITRTANQLMLHYQLFDVAFDSRKHLRSQVFIPTASSPKRQHNLWETTCFEFFLGIQNSPQYWEFNLSPSGDWNVYHFSDYRTGMQEESAFTSLPFEIDVQEKQISLTIELNLNAIVHPNQPLDIAITSVIETIPHHITYWALQHCGTEADFHLRESFTLKLASLTFQTRSEGFSLGSSPLKLSLWIDNPEIIINTLYKPKYYPYYVKCG